MENPALPQVESHAFEYCCADLFMECAFGNLGIQYCFQNLLHTPWSLVGMKRGGALICPTDQGPIKRAAMNTPGEHLISSRFRRGCVL
jgi:hypothetical protein